RLRDSGLVTDLRRDLSSVLNYTSALQVANSCGVHCSVLSVVVALCVPLRDLNPDVCHCGWGGSVVAPEILHSLPRLVFGIERAMGGDVSRVGLRYLAYRVVARPVLVVCLRGDEISALEQCGLDPRVEELHCPPVEEVATGG